MTEKKPGERIFGLVNTIKGNYPGHCVLDGCCDCEVCNLEKILVEIHGIMMEAKDLEKETNKTVAEAKRLFYL